MWSETPVIMLISTALLLDSINRNSVCTPAKLPCRRVEVGYVRCVSVFYDSIKYVATDDVSYRGKRILWET
jgi:hypothetical protein